MPFLDFNYSKKEKKVKSNITSNVKYEVLEKGVSGVVYIAPDFSYYVVVRSKIYKFTINSFKCKGKRRIYAQHLDKYNQRICIIRNPDFKLECNKLFFLPFAAGSCVIGDIVHNSITNEDLFRFRKIVIEYMHPKAHEAIEIWRANKESLDSKRKESIIKYYE